MGLLTYASLCLFGLLLSSPFPGAMAYSCPRYWVEIQGNCFGYFESKKTWAEAEIACQNYGPRTHLASIHNEAETDFIANYISQYQHKTNDVWIGLYDPNKDGTWRWSDGSPYDYKPWAMGQPDNCYSGEYCVELSRFTGFKYWNDNQCQKGNAYICKQEL